MGYKVKTNTQMVDEQLMQQFSALGLEIELPKDDEEEKKEDKKKENE